MLSVYLHKPRLAALELRHTHVPRQVDCALEVLKGQWAASDVCGLLLKREDALHDVVANLVEVIQQIRARVRNGNRGRVGHWSGRRGEEVVDIRDKLVQAPLKGRRWGCRTDSRIVL